jgi:arabinofuranosyltransferase
MDHALLYKPYLAYYFIKHVPLREWWKGFLAATPLFAWLIFSFVYYGFIFPNTYYAKLNTGIPQSIMWEHGFQYLHDLRYRQPVAALLFFAIILLIYNRIFFVRKIKQSVLFYTAVAGVAFFCVYVVYSGGDYMSGRFWVSPLFMSSILFAWWLPKIQKNFFLIATAFFIALAIMLKANLVILSPHSKQEWLYGNIVNERNVYSNTHLFFSKTPYTEHPWVKLGRALKAENSKEIKTIQYSYIGMSGYYGGDKLRIIDPLALSDPFLSRLPALHHSRIGHFDRIIPAGYFEARRMGDYSHMEPALRDKALQMKAITQLPIFSKERWQAMRSYYFSNSEN